MRFTTRRSSRINLPMSSALTPCLLSSRLSLTSTWFIDPGLLPFSMTHLPTDETSLPPETTVQAGELVPGAQNREHLVLEHLWQVSLIVRQMKARMPTWANADELQAAGILGLLAAIDQYSSDHSSTLRTFAEHKIRSAILDSLRALDWASRGQRKHLRLCERAKAK